MFEGFERINISGERSNIFARVSARDNQEPILLLHGFPETGAMWHGVAERLAESHTVVIPDLRGYGRSTAWGDNQSFRAMARDLLILQDQLNLNSWHIYGHDRGGRAAHRFSKDHPDRTRSVALMDVVPTLSVWEKMNTGLVLDYYHWAFLGANSALAQVLAKADPDEFLNVSLDDLAGTKAGGFLQTLPRQVQSEYLAAIRNPLVISAICADYRAAAAADIENDRRDASISAVPASIIWGSEGAVDAYFDVVQSWGSEFNKLRGDRVAGGHFFVEESPVDAWRAIGSHLDWVQSLD